MWLEVILAILISVLYVASIQVAIPSDLRSLSRDDAGVTRFRVRRVIAMCITWLVLLAALWKGSNSWTESFSSIIAEIGFSILVRGLSYTLFRMVIMYSLPMMQSLWELSVTPSILSEIKRLLFTLHGFRDYIFAPALEELVYRGLVWVCVKRGSTESTAYLHAALWWTPFLFGIAHIHHHVMHLKDNVSRALTALLVQTTYTAAFGALANQEYLRNGSIWNSVAAHTICNMMGIPDLGRDRSSILQYAVYLSVTFGCLIFALFAM